MTIPGHHISTVHFPLINGSMQKPVDPCHAPSFPAINSSVHVGSQDFARSTAVETDAQLLPPPWRENSLPDPPRKFLSAIFFHPSPNRNPILACLLLHGGISASGRFHFDISMHLQVRLGWFLLPASHYSNRYCWLFQPCMLQRAIMDVVRQ